MADADADLLPNAAEIHHGLDPLSVDASPYQRNRVDIAVRVRWLGKTGLSGLSLAFRTSTNGVHWFVNPALPIVDRSDLIAPVRYRWQEVVLPLSDLRRLLQFLHTVD